MLHVVLEVFHRYVLGLQQTLNLQPPVVNQPAERIFMLEEDGGFIKHFRHVPHLLENNEEQVEGISHSSSVQCLVRTKEAENSPEHRE